MRYDSVRHSLAGALLERTGIPMLEEHRQTCQALNVLYVVQVSDNSGAKTAQCINQSGRSWGIGDIITVAIKSAAVRGTPLTKESLTEFLHAPLSFPDCPCKKASVGWGLATCLFLL